MSQEFESDFDDIGCTRSGKKYKVDFRSYIFENSLDNTRQQSHSQTERIEGVLDQGPAATEEAASFGGKKLRQSYDAVARFQLESRAENHDFQYRKIKEGNGT